MGFLTESFAQIRHVKSNKQNVSKKTFAIRGKVTDSIGLPISAIQIHLQANARQQEKTTNNQGEFLFDNLKAGSFKISINAFGYIPFSKDYEINNVELIDLAITIVLKTNNNQLHEVLVVAKPLIVFKSDTVEFRAKDYRFDIYSPLKDLIKKIDGIEVGINDNVTYNGQPVTKMRLNGKDFAGGDVAQAIKNLPAEIADKIQVVDYYGENTERTGVISGEPTKILNITTLPEKSIGNILRSEGTAGTQSRYSGMLYTQYLNGDQQYGIIANRDNTLNGLASTNVTSGSSYGVVNKNDFGIVNGGRSSKTNFTTFYSDYWGSHTFVNLNYNHNARNSTSLVDVNGAQLTSLGSFEFNNKGDVLSKSVDHTIKLEIKQTFGEHQYLNIIPTLVFNESTNETQLQQIFTGIIKQKQSGNTLSEYKSPNKSTKIFYQYKFNHPIRNLSIDADLISLKVDQVNDVNKKIQYFNQTSNYSYKDSIFSSMVSRISDIKTYNVNLSYVEPLSFRSKLEFVAKTSSKYYGINASRNNDSINTYINNFSVNFKVEEVNLAYKFNQGKYNLTIGTSLLRTYLKTENISENFTQTVNRQNYILPIFRFQYAWSNFKRMSINYTRQPSEPGINQIQPFTDRSDPLNIITGNPRLLPSLNHLLMTQYNSYSINTKIALNLNVYLSILEDPVLNNTIQRYEPQSQSLVNEVIYINNSQRVSTGVAYLLSKALKARKISLSISGRWTFTTNPVMNNGNAFYNKINTWNHRIGFNFTPNDYIDINTYGSFAINKNKFGINGNSNSFNNYTFVSDGKIHLPTRWLFGYTLIDNMVDRSGASAKRNSLVINISLDREFFKRKNLLVGLKIFDVLRQNYFINQTVTDYAIIQTNTNPLSRYLLFNIKYNLQQWKGTPSKNGVPLTRRGDGSFIHN